MLDDPNDPAQPVGVARFPANVVDGVRWNAAFAYLDPARDRPNLTIRGSSLVDRVVFDGTRAAGVVTSNGEHIDADCIVLASGAYFTPAVLLRSGVGPPDDLRQSRHRGGGGPARRRRPARPPRHRGRLGAERQAVARDGRPRSGERAAVRAPHTAQGGEYVVSGRQLGSPPAAVADPRRSAARPVRPHCRRLPHEAVVGRPPAAAVDRSRRAAARRARLPHTPRRPGRDRRGHSHGAGPRRDGAPAFAARRRVATRRERRSRSTSAPPRATTSTRRAPARSGRWSTSSAVSSASTGWSSPMRR